MKALCVICFVLLVPLDAKVSAATKEINVALADFDYPPFYFKDQQGQWTGVSIETLKKTLESLSVELKVHQVPFTRLLNSVEKGLYDVVVVLYKTPERERTFEFSQWAYLKEPNHLLCAVPCSFDFSGEASSLKDKGVAVVRNYSYGHHFDRIRNILRNEYETESVMFKLLVNHKIELAMAARSSIEWSQTLRENRGKFKVLEPALGEEFIYFAFSKYFASKTELMNQVNINLLKYIRSVDYLHMLNKYRLRSLSVRE